MKLLLLLLGANALVDGFTEVHGVKFRDVPEHRDDRAQWHRVREAPGAVLWRRKTEQLEFFGLPVTMLSFLEGKRGAGFANVAIQTDDCPALLKALTAAWGAPRDDDGSPNAIWMGSTVFAELTQGDDCILIIASRRWDAAKHVWKR